MLVTQGKTSKLIDVFIQDNSVVTGAGLSGLLFNSAGLICYYHRETAGASVAVTLVDMTVGTWTSGGFKEIDGTNMPGWYQFGIPNAALASGSEGVGIHFQGATDMVPLPVRVELTAVDLFNATSAGISRIDENISAAKTLTTGERDDIADAYLDLVSGIETNLTPRSAMKLMASLLIGLASGFPATNPKLFTSADLTTDSTGTFVVGTDDRVSATTDTDGNRSAIYVDLS